LQKEESEFFIAHKYADGRVTYRTICKSCHSEGEMKRYYRKQQYIDSQKTPCLKCGEARTRCICFHHVDPSKKEFTIAQLRKSNLKTIQNEIDKCVCLCLNCHHEFHYLNGAYQMSLDEYLNLELADSYNSSTPTFEVGRVGA
jgi:hypothetical protein